MFILTLSLSLMVRLEMSIPVEWKTIKLVSSVTVKKNFSMPLTHNEVRFGVNSMGKNIKMISFKMTHRMSREGKKIHEKYKM